MFEKASRLKLRFETDRGFLSAEDLWDIPLTSTSGKVNLDDLARGLHKQLKDADVGVSFVNKERNPNEELQLRFELVKHVIDVKLAEQQAASEARMKNERKQQLLSLIAQKELEQLADTSLDELKAQVASM